MTGVRVNSSKLLLGDIKKNLKKYFINRLVIIGLYHLFPDVKKWSEIEMNFKIFITACSLLVTLTHTCQGSWGFGDFREKMGNLTKSYNPDEFEDLNLLTINQSIKNSKKIPEEGILLPPTEKSKYFYYIISLSFYQEKNHGSKDYSCLLDGDDLIVNPKVAKLEEIDIVQDDSYKIEFIKKLNETQEEQTNLLQQKIKTQSESILLNVEKETEAFQEEQKKLITNLLKQNFLNFQNEIASFKKNLIEKIKSEPELENARKIQEKKSFIEDQNKIDLEDIGKELQKNKYYPFLNPYFTKSSTCQRILVSDSKNNGTETHKTVLSYHFTIENFIKKPQESQYRGLKLNINILRQPKNKTERLNFAAVQRNPIYQY